MRLIQIGYADIHSESFGVADDFRLATAWGDEWLRFEKADGGDVAIRLGPNVMWVNVYDELPK